MAQINGICLMFSCFFSFFRKGGLLKMILTAGTQWRNHTLGIVEIKFHLCYSKDYRTCGSLSNSLKSFNLTLSSLSD